ncbi:hypothetical protein NLJ89_g7297 [Agrocybe chaxingu]|uniref:Uncharacterized protein n=1 Tax=Agrocybe chaxingu TaxID=84603 RepID=A0A9W8MV72_9AGAR|nr:hypothetical protein NLJ89_g7297 [Agrocybe chaxingu]
MEEQRPMYPFKLEGPAPSPETVNILDRRFRSICLDWSNVVDVTLAAVTVDECLELFRQGRQVGCCDLQVQAGNHGYPIPDRPILHEGIERMDISFWGDDGLAPQLFDKIAFPSLAHLENSPGQTRHTSIDSPAAFFSRSACLVHHVKLSRLQVSVADVIRVLQTLPTVQFLHLFDITLTEEFFNFIKETNVISGVGDCFLPCLETLCFSGPRQYSWTLVQRLIPLFSPSPEEDQVLRLWRELEIGVLEEGPDRTFIDEDTIAYFDNLGRRGIRANVEDLTSGGDYIKDSREYHNRRQQGEHTGAEHRQDDD